MNIHPQIPLDFTRNFESEVFEEDLEYQEPPAPIFQKTANNDNNPLQTKNLIISTIGAASCFLHTTFPKKTHVATLKLPGIAQSKFPAKYQEIREEECKVWTVSDEILLVTCQYTVPEDRAWAWVETLWQNIKMEKLIVLDTLFLTKYQTLQSVQTPLIRKIHSAKYQPSNSITLLEPPNILDNFPGILLMFSEVKQVPMVAYLSLADTFDLSYLTLKSYEEALTSEVSGLTISTDQTPQYKEILKQLPVRKSDHIYL